MGGVPHWWSLFSLPSQVSDLVIILNQRRAIEAFTKGGNLTLGGNLTVAVGPVGRSVQPPVRSGPVLQGPDLDGLSNPLGGNLPTSPGEGGFLPGRKNQSRSQPPRTGPQGPLLSRSTRLLRSF